MHGTGRGCLLLIAIGGALLALIHAFVGGVMFAPVHCSDVACAANRNLVETAVHSSMLAVVFLILILAGFGEGGALLLAAAVVAFAVTTLAAVQMGINIPVIRLGTTITASISLVLAIASVAIAAVWWRERG